MTDKERSKLADALVELATGPMREEISSYKDIDEAEFLTDNSSRQTPRADTQTAADRSKFEKLLRAATKTL